jgi:DNA polymerase III gamma/tau subunit
MLSSGAWNALLKTLEEPPPHAVFVFATTDPHKLPATILSRVQRYDFKLVPTKRIVEHVASILDAEKLKYEPGALMLVARESGGSVRDSLSLLDQVIASTNNLTEQSVGEVLGVADRALLQRLGRAVLGRDPNEALAVVDAAFTRGYDLPQLGASFLGHLRDLVVAGSVKDPAVLIEASASDVDELVAQAKATPPGLAEMMFARFAKVVEEASKSPLPRYVLEVGLVELTRVEPLETIGHLVAKLEALESRVEKGGGGGGGGEPRPRAAAPAPTGTAPAPTQRAEAPRAEAPRGVNTLDQLFEKITDPVLIGPLHQARVLSWDASKLSLGFESEFAADQVKERVQTLRNAIDGKIAIEIVVGPAPAGGKLPGTETLIEVEQRKQDEDREKRRQEALEHPARKLIDDKLGGTWKEPVVDLEDGNG